MTALFKTIATNTVSGSASLVLSVPAGTANGDILIMVATNSAGISYASVTGWTLIQDAKALFITSTDTTVWWRVANSEPSSYTVTMASSSATQCGAIIRYSGQDLNSPIRWSAYARFDADTTALSSNTTGNSAQVNDAVIICWGVRSTSVNAGAFSYTPPGGTWNTRASLSQASVSDYTCGLLIVDKVNGTDNPSATTNIASHGWTVPELTIAASQAAGNFLPFFQ